jgi:hypothetical protein
VLGATARASKLATGECVSGPCFGKRSPRLPIEERDGAIYLADNVRLKKLPATIRATRRW